MKQFYDTYTSMAFVSPKMTQIQMIENQDKEIVTSVRTQLGKPDKKVSSAGTQMEVYDIRDTILAKLSWTHHRTIFSRCKTNEEREFYLRICIKENYSVKELDKGLLINFGAKSLEVKRLRHPKNKMSNTIPDNPKIFKSN